MHLKFRNVNDAFRGLVQGIYDGTISTYTMPSRVGEVQQVEEPVIVTYSHPLERVLFNQARDANPFFHLYEAMWMLAGMNEIAPLTYYSSNYAAQVQDGNSHYANGAYGKRWRSARMQSRNPIDQLIEIIYHLKNKPESRRAVLQMWNAEDDLLKIDSSKDVCCNTHAYFSVEQGRCILCGGSGTYIENQTAIIRGEIRDVEGTTELCPGCNGKPHDRPQYLNMTVCNRSNDLIWGMLGANVVHFSFLQEYMAAHLGLEVGVYNQMTNNLHCYTERWEPELWLAEYKQNLRGGQADYPKSVLLVKDPMVFDKEVIEFAEQGWGEQTMSGFNFTEPFIRDVAFPMRMAFHFYKRKEFDFAINCTDSIAAGDWRIACKQWLERRAKKYAVRS